MVVDNSMNYHFKKIKRIGLHKGDKINDKRSIRKKLKVVRVPDYIYNLTGKGVKDERLCLEKIQDKWSVYYLERGIKTTNEIFESEEDACQFLYAQLMN